MKLDINTKYGAINALKTILACLIAYVLGNLQVYLFDFQSKYIWMIVTILVVMSTQPNVGGVVNKALMRFLGTFVGAFVSLLIIFLGLNSILDYLLVLGSLFIFIFIAGVYPKYSYAGFLAALTIAIINFNGDISVSMALLRVSEIIQGISVALLVNRYIYPITAQARMKDNFVATLNKIHELFKNFGLADKTEYRKLSDSTVSLYIKQSALLKELAYEMEDSTHYQNLHYTFLRIYRYTGAFRDYMNLLVEQDKLVFGEQTERFQAHCERILVAFAKSIDAEIQIPAKDMNEFNKYFSGISDGLIDGLGNDSSVIVNNYVKLFGQAMQDFYFEYNALIAEK